MFIFYFEILHYNFTRVENVNGETNIIQKNPHFNVFYLHLKYPDRMQMIK